MYGRGAEGKEGEGRIEREGGWGREGTGKKEAGMERRGGRRGERKEDWYGGGGMMSNENDIER